MSHYDYDYIIIGSGFGGSVSALRLAEKGYRVLVLEKGKWFKAQDFPTTNWQLKKWLWLPILKFYGLFKLTPFRHVTVLSGVGVGGGSLVYANTLPVPKTDFFQATTWAHLADWETELKPFYETALRMLGAIRNPYLQTGDYVLHQIAHDLGKPDQYDSPQVAVYFGNPAKPTPDPFFGGRGPDRTGCNLCGGCMLGCRFGAKNTLDKNYLHLAQQLGATIQAESEVYEVRPWAEGYEVKWRQSTAWLWPQKGRLTCRGVVFAGGVLGTVQLLLKLKETTLPRLSPMLGTGVRTNSESLIGVTSVDKDKDFSKGIAISSIFHPDEHSHIEPVRNPEGANIWRLLMGPLVYQPHLLPRLAAAIGKIIRQPRRAWQVWWVDDWAKRTQIMLFMQSVNSQLRFKRGLFGVMVSALDKGEAPTSFIPLAAELARRFGQKVNGTSTMLLNEMVLGTPTTAHILGGAVMGRNSMEGVIDKDNRVFGYDNLYICDGSMISANIGVNPSLTITALAERAMSKIPPCNKFDNLSQAH